MVDQLAQEYAESPVIFLEYPVDAAPSSRNSRFWAAYGSGSVTLPEVMVDSGNQISNGYIDFYTVYKSMVDTALLRPAKAEMRAYFLRGGSRVRFGVWMTNLSGVTLSSIANGATVHGLVYEDAHVADTDRFVRSAISTALTPDLAAGATASFTLETPDLTGVNWDKLHFIALADYRPGGSIGAYDTLQAARASRASMMRHDIDADGRSDISVYRRSSGAWYTLPSTSPGSVTSTVWGLPTDAEVSGDYDGDGRTDAAVWRPSTGTWFVMPSSTPDISTTTQWGLPTDKVIPGDYDGDFKTDIAAWRPGTGIWYILPSTSPGSFSSTQWGVQGDVPVPSDYDGDGKTDIAVWRPGTGTWYIVPSTSPSSYTSTQWGTQGDIPVPSDYDGDGKADLAVWRQSTGTWYVLSSATPGTFTPKQWGTPTDKPVPGDYDGDGRVDIAVWRPGNGVWYVIPSSAPATYTATQWGTDGDNPLSSITCILNALP